MEPNFFAHPAAIGQGHPLHGLDDSHQGEMAARKPAGRVPHQLIVCKNEKREEAPAMAMPMASSSPTHTSAEDIFSDTMELASYLHRRVQEIGKQFRHRPFRINTSEKLQSAPGFLKGLSRASEPSPGSTIAKTCEPGEFAVLRENTESAEERLSSFPNEKPSAVSCFSNCSNGYGGDRAFDTERKINNLYNSRSVCTEMKEYNIFNLYNNGYGGGRAFETEKKISNLHDSRPNDGRAWSREELSLMHSRENVSLTSENAHDSVRLSQRKGEDTPAKYRDGKLPFFAETGCVSMCCMQIHGSIMQDNSQKQVSDVNLINFQGGKNLNTCLDAANCPASGCREGKNPQLPCSTPSHVSSEHLFCRASSGTSIGEHFSLDLKLPSLQDPAISDAEDARGLPPLHTVERDFRHPEHSTTCIVESHMPSHAGLQVDLALPESVRKQGNVHAQITHSEAVAENASSPHSNLRHSMSSVDSSECDNWGTDGDKGHTATMGVRMRNDNGEDGKNTEEIDAMSEAMHVDTHRKEDVNGTIASFGCNASGKAESKSDVLDLLLDAIQVTSGGGLAVTDGADACGPSSLPPMKHVPETNGDKSSEEKKDLSLAKMLPTNKKMSDQDCCLSERVHGSTCSNSSHRIDDDMHESGRPQLVNDLPCVQVGSFPIVRKRTTRCPKTSITKEPSRNSDLRFARFKCLQALSEVDLPNNRKGGKNLAANNGNEKEVERGKSLDSSESCLNSKRERTWEKQQDTLGTEDYFSKQEKREKVTDEDDLRKDTRKQLSPALEGEVQEQGMLSRRARLQVLPTKFSDSVLQPWKKGNRRRS